MFVTLLGMIVFLQPAFRVLVAVSIIALQLLRESNCEFPSSTINEVMPMQFWKGLPYISCKLFGMVMEVRPVQPEKAYLWISFMPLGIVMDVKPVQPSKA